MRNFDKYSEALGLGAREVPRADERGGRRAGLLQVPLRREEAELELRLPRGGLASAGRGNFRGLAGGLPAYSISISDPSFQQVIISQIFSNL